jgi:hypothetical protein
MAELNQTWVAIFDHIRHVCIVKGMAMPTKAWSISKSGETAVVDLPAEGSPQLTSGALSWDAVDIIVADPAEKLPFLFTKSATGQLHWHRPAAHA